MAFVDRLGSSPETLRAFLDQIPAGVAAYDATGRIVARNDRLDELVGAAPESLTTLAFQRPDGQAFGADEAPAARILGGKTLVREDVAVGRADGTMRAARISTLPLPEGGGLLLLSDPPGADPLLKQILGIVAHDLRNPLAAMRMTAQLLAKAGDMAEERRATLAKRIVSSSGRMDALVRGLLDYARAQAGALIKLTPEATELGALVRRIGEEQQQLYPGRVVNVETRGDLSGTWDPDRLEQVLTHLLANALRHGSDEAPVTVLAEGDGAGVKLVIHNRGPAIPAEAMGDVFEPFTVGPRPPGAPRKNIGLGLFVVKRFVEAHGGKVDAVSTADEGTTLTVRLPRSTPAEQVT